MNAKIHIILAFGVINLFFNSLNAQPSLKGKSGISKRYAIESARMADRSYKFAKLSYMVSEQPLVQSSLDSASFFILQSISTMDSAIYYANDSDLMALDLANISRSYAGKAHTKIKQALTANGSYRRTLARDATFLSANAVTDAYHASFYFGGELKKKEPEIKKEEPKEKVVTKLDVDQSLFSTLTKELDEKINSNQKELERLNNELAKTKEAGKTAKLKTQIKKLTKENEELVLKNNESKVKLAEINKQIEERDKGGKPPEEPKLAKGLHYETVEEWNKHIIIDQELPVSLVYQVQVGVYKNKVLYEIFKGLTPVYGKTTPQGVSYAIGLFDKMEDANQAKDYVKSIGIADAFVVAYYNKKRITPAEALKLEKK